MSSVGPAVGRRAFTIGAVGLGAGWLGACSTGDEAPVSSGEASSPTRAPSTAVWTSRAPIPIRPLRPQVVLPPELPDVPPTVIRGVRVFDGVETSSQPLTVVLQDGVVAAIGAEVPVPDGAEEVDGAGRTLVPGLIDAHVHTGDYDTPAQGVSLSYGVTTQLDMFSPPGGRWRAEQERTGRTGHADLFSAGHLATHPDGHGTQFGVAVPTLTEPGQAEQWVQDRVAEGSDYIKIVVESNFRMTALDPEVVRALVAAAHAEGLLAVGHAQFTQDTEVAIAAGVDGLVHSLVDGPYSATALEALRERGMFVVTTVGLIHRSADKRLLEDEEALTWLRPEDLRGLREDYFARSSTVDPEQARANLVQLAEEGIPVLAGSDAPNPGTTYGAGLLIELELLVQAGLTPARALVTATSAPAETFGLRDRGRLAEGLRADAVLVEGDPTEDIVAMRRIERVWKLGVPVERTPVS